MTDAREIAVGIVGEIEWQDGFHGYCQCPGRRFHSKANGKRDCMIRLDGAPTIFCFHASCEAEVDEANRRLRHDLGVEKARTGGYGSGARPVRTPHSSLPTPHCPLVTPMECARAYLNGSIFTEADLAMVSPVVLEDDWRLDGALVVGVLYGAQEKVNIVTDHTVDNGQAKPKGYGVTLPRDAMVAKLRAGGVGTEAGGWFRFNPVDEKGIADRNVTAYRYMLIESDSLPLDIQVSLYARFLLPVAAIMTSGGKSIHCLVRVDAVCDADYRVRVGRVLSALRRYGFDGKNKNPGRLSRLPGVERKIGAGPDGRQRLLYLNPNPLADQRIKP